MKDKRINQTTTTALNAQSAWAYQSLLSRLKAYVLAMQAMQRNRSKQMTKFAELVSKKVKSDVTLHFFS